MYKAALQGAAFFITINLLPQSENDYPRTWRNFWLFLGIRYISKQINSSINLKSNHHE